MDVASNRMTVVVEGAVLDVERVTGVSRASGQPYDFRVARVLCGKADVLDLVLGDEVPTPAEGEMVAYRAVISVRNDGSLSASAVGLVKV